MERETEYPAEGIIESINRCRINGEFTDFVLICQGMEFKVHKIVICPQSKVLRSACIKGFREAVSGVYETDDDSHLVFSKMIDYLYTMDYDETQISPSEQESDSVRSALQTHARVFALADKYDIPGLRKFAVRRYRETLVKAKTMQELLPPVLDIYELTPPSVRPLRDLVVNHFREYGRQMITEHTATERGFFEMIDAVPDFGKDLLRLWLSAPIRGHCRDCGSGQRMEVLQARCLRCQRGSTWSYH